MCRAIESGDISALAECFHSTHEQIYTHADRDAPVQIINLRLVALGQSPKPRFEAEEEQSAAAHAEGEVSIYHRWKTIKCGALSARGLTTGPNLRRPGHRHSKRHHGLYSEKLQGTGEWLRAFDPEPHQG